MSLARTLDLCDAVVAAIQANWSPAAPSAVQRVYAPDIGIDPEYSGTLIAGRQVYVFPVSYATPARLSRSQLWRRHTIAVVTAERYTDAGPPPNAWVDERTGFVEGIYNLLGNPLLVLSGAVVKEARPTPEDTASVDVLYNLDLLLGTKNRAFWSQCTFNFQEPTSYAGG